MLSVISSIGNLKWSTSKMCPSAESQIFFQTTDTHSSCAYSILPESINSTFSDNNQIPILSWIPWKHGLPTLVHDTSIVVVAQDKIPGVIFGSPLFVMPHLCFTMMLNPNSGSHLPLSTLLLWPGASSSLTYNYLLIGFSASVLAPLQFYSPHNGLNESCKISQIMSLHYSKPSNSSPFHIE